MVVSRLATGPALGVGAVVTGGTDTSGSFANTASPQLVAHAGLPIAVACTQHMIVLLAPELRAGYSTLLNDGSFSLMEFTPKIDLEMQPISSHRLTI